MADEKNEKKKKKKRTRAQEERNYRILYVILYPIWNFFYPFKVLHRGRIPEGPCIICPNHTSLADPPMICFAASRKHIIRIMAKKSLLEIPIMGRVLDAIGTFAVDRGSNDMSAIKNALRVLKDGCKLMMFPEGTRVGEGEEGSAKTGAAMIALKTGAPIVPVYSTRPKKMFHRSTVVFGEPYVVKPAGRRATKEEQEAVADDLLSRIYALESEAQ